MKTITPVPRAAAQTLIAKREQLLVELHRIQGQAGREGRPTTYAEDREIAGLKARIARIERQLFGRSRSKVRTTAKLSTGAKLEQLQRTRGLTIRNAAGRRRTGNLSTLQARAFV